MVSQQASAIQEFRDRWLPNATDEGLNELLELLDNESPMLMRRHWTTKTNDVSDFAIGCLATHVAWHHPKTEHLHAAAGFEWLRQVVGLDTRAEPSYVINAWDRGEPMAPVLVELIKEELQRRADRRPATTGKFQFDYP